VCRLPIGGDTDSARDPYLPYLHQDTRIINFIEPAFSVLERFPICAAFDSHCDLFYSSLIPLSLAVLKLGAPLCRRTSCMEQSSRPCTVRILYGVIFLDLNSNLYSVFYVYPETFFITSTDSYKHDFLIGDLL